MTRIELVKRTEIQQLHENSETEVAVDMLVVQKNRQVSRTVNWIFECGRRAGGRLWKTRWRTFMEDQQEMGTTCREAKKVATDQWRKLVSECLVRLQQQKFKLMLL